MAAYELKYTAEEIDGILESVDEKTIYGDATQSAHGLMSAEDKSKLDTLPNGRELSDAFDLKVDKRVPSTAGNLAKLTGEGNIADSGYSVDDFATEQQGMLAETAYQKPQGGIPSTDMSAGVRASLGKADTALQEHQDISWKQDLLVSGTNIKTVNGESLLGSGNIEIQGGGGEDNVIEAITMNGASVPVTNKTAAITETDPTVPSWAKQPNKPSYNYSEIGNTPDLSGFITKSVNDLTNYYLKSETYTKDEVAALIGAIQQFHYEIYPTLPASGESNVLYLIGPTGSGTDKYEEYVYSNNAFTKIGDTSIDLSGYVTTSALNTALADYATTQDLEDAKVFFAEANVTTFAEIQDAIDAGRTVMLKDEDGYVYNFLFDSEYEITFSCSSAEESFIKSYAVYNDDSWDLFEIDNYESQENRVESISSSSDDGHYPTAKAVYDIVSTKYTKPSGGIPASDIAFYVQNDGNGIIGQGNALISYINGGDGMLYAVGEDNAGGDEDKILATTDYVDNTIGDLATVATSGDYDDLTNKPKIPIVPKNVSAFTNDAGYLTQHQSLTNYVQKSQTAGLLKNDGTVDTNTYLTQHQDISGKADKTLVSSSMPAGGFLPNVVYNLGTLSGNTTFLMAAATDNTIANIWCWTFTTPSTAPTITWPAGITGWSGGSTPTINASKSYEVTVMNGLATIIES